MKKIVLFSFVLITAFFAVSFLLYAKPYARYCEEESRLLSDYEAERQVAMELEREMSYQGTDAFIEKIAREKLGYVRPDEIVFYNLAD